MLLATDGRSGRIARSTLGALLLALAGCGGSGGAASGNGGNARDSGGGSHDDGSASSHDDGGGGDATAATDSAGPVTDVGAESSAGGCSPDPLRTDLTAQQTGVSVDAFDCQILKWTAQAAEPDPMIFKAIIYVESRFDATSVACPNLPCGTPNGWTAAESGCYGLMQIVPACGGVTNSPGLLPSGHPDLEKTMTASDWTSSVFNPDVNIRIGIAGVADNRSQEMKKFVGCTVDQYTMMAIGDYNSYGSTKSCTVYNTAYDNLVLQAYHQYATAAGYAAHGY
jgi:hypothetical protein